MKTHHGFTDIAQRAIVELNVEKQRKSYKFLAYIKLHFAKFKGVREKFLFLFKVKSVQKRQKTIKKVVLLFGTVGLVCVYFV